MLGRAMDFYIPGVPLKKLRDIGLKMQGGGVGYYPTSGSPFVHMDVGNVRHWPRHQPPGTGQRCSPTARRCMCRATAGRCPAMSRRWPPTRRARAPARPTSKWPAPAAARKKSGGFLSAFFGGGGDDEADDSADVETASAAPAPRAESLKPAATAKSSNLPGIAIVAPENAQRAEIPQVADEQAPEPEKDTPETIIAALPAKEIPLPDFAPRPKADVGAQQPENVPFAMASDRDHATAATEQAVATAQAPAEHAFRQG